MNKNDIIFRLQVLPEEIELREEQLITSRADLIVAKDNLQHKEDGLWLGVLVDNNGSTIVIDGKNAEIRSAQMRQHTYKEQKAVSDLELQIMRNTHQVTKLYNELKSLQSIVDLLKGAA